MYWNGEAWNGFDILFALVVFAVWTAILLWVVHTLADYRRHHMHR